MADDRAPQSMRPAKIKHDQPGRQGAEVPSRQSGMLGARGSSERR